MAPLFVEEDALYNLSSKVISEQDKSAGMVYVFVCADNPKATAKALKRKIPF